MRSGAKVENFGCRLNAWESEVIRNHTAAPAFARMVVVNTCAVTAEAERQARQLIRKTRRQNPHAQIVVTGCAAQIDPQSWQAMDEVDAVLGNHEKLGAEHWQALAAHNSGDLPSYIGDIMQVREVAPHLLSGFDHKARAFLQIQQGCDHRCSFCIIPYGRGVSRSVSLADTIAQIEMLVAHGVQEVVLTGVDISSWGYDLGQGVRLGQLVKAILRAVPDLPRLRLSSLDPADIDADLRDAFGGEERLMPHAHLSVQHGDGLMLKRMKRRHSPDDVKNLVEDLRVRRGDIVFGGDIIAGFPTETDEAHQRSLDFIESLNISWLHIFPFSPRHGTPAARMPQVSGGVIRKRASEFRQLGAMLAQKQLDAMVGRTDEVVLESGGIAHTRQFAKVVMGAGEARLTAGARYPVRILRADEQFLHAEALL